MTIQASGTFDGRAPATLESDYQVSNSDAREISLYPSTMRSRPMHQRKPHNRIRAVMSHITHYSFRGEPRLAADAGISKSALNRICNGHTSPSFMLVCSLSRAVSQRAGRQISPCELLSCDGTYPTRYVCSLFDCRCLPDAAYDEEGNRRPEYAHITPGEWTTEDFPALGESEVE